MSRLYAPSIGYQEKSDAAGPPAQAIPGGRRVCQSVACSQACASCSTTEYWPSAALICSPIGRPEALNPQGTEIVGQPKTSNGDVSRIFRFTKSAEPLRSPVNSAMAGGR